MIFNFIFIRNVFFKTFVVTGINKKKEIKKND